MDDALRALNRFGLGARIGERAAVGEPRAWLRAQLSGGAPLLAGDAGSYEREVIRPHVLGRFARGALDGGGGLAGPG